MGTRISLPVRLNRRKSRRGMSCRLLNNTNGTLLIMAVATSFAFVNPDIGNGQVRVKVDCGKFIGDEFFDLKRTS